MTTVLKLVDVEKNFFQADQKIEVIKGVNLEVEKGKMVALIGPSGSGKTTLLQIAGLLDNPTSGKVFINNVELTKADDKTRTEARKSNIGFVYQSHHLMPEFSSIENVAIPLLIQGKPRLESFLEAKELLQKIGLGDRINHKPSELSGGQQQRVAIARAVITKPSLILADEPTGNLDSDFAGKIFDLLHSLTKQQQIACLMVTHNSDLAKKADSVVSIKDGTISVA